MKKWGIFSVILGHMLDIYTTALPGGAEDNAYARDPLHHPLFGHLIIIKLFFLSAYAFLGFIGYKSLQKISQRLADLAVVGFCIYAAYDCFQVAFSNWLVYVQWYQP